MAKIQKQQAEKVEKPAVSSLSIPNGSIMTLLNWCNIGLNPQKARARNRAIAPFQAKFKEFEEARLALIEKFGKKDEAGKLVMEKKMDPMTGLQEENFAIADREAFDKEYKALAAEIAVIDVLPSNVRDLKDLKSILNNDIKMEMDIETTAKYEHIMSVFASL